MSASEMVPPPVEPSRDFCEASWVVEGVSSQVSSDQQSCYVVLLTMHTHFQLGPFWLDVAPYSNGELVGISEAGNIHGTWKSNFPAFDVEFADAMQGSIRGYIAAEHLNIVHGE